MEAIHGWPDPPLAVPVVLTIGVFDGVHLGHQALIGEVVRRAESLGLPAVVLTFHPHPRSVIAPESNWGYICSLEERLARIADLGPSLAIVLRFDRVLADTSAEQFMRDLCQHLPLRELCVGAGFSLGRAGQGDLEVLRILGERGCFLVRAIPPVQVDGQVVSSTQIRQRIQQGRVDEVVRWLGRPFCLRGQVVPGMGQGRLLGFPTANLNLHPRQILPADGVYAVQAHFPAALNFRSPWPALGYVGHRPTFGERERGVEVHLLDFAQDLRGCELRLKFVQRLRPDRRFAGPEALIAQMRQDEQLARKLLA
ncbi:MAG: riboflavin biosynthesis protein RibF [Chloroflexia bacterium]|nr:riboflavin biosynthesis protein RibF [Chloroflexia bacterium]